MLIDLVVLFLLFLSGLCLLVFSKVRMPGYIILTLSFPSGLAFYLLASAFLLAVQFPFGFPMVAIILLVPILVNLVYYFPKNSSLYIKGGLYFVTVLCLAYIGTNKGYTSVSDDSYVFIASAKVLNQHAFLNNEIMLLFNSWGIGITLVYSLSELLGGEVFKLFHPFLFTNFVFLILVSAFEILYRKSKKFLKSIMLSLIVFLFLLSISFVRFQFSYMHNNLMTAQFLFIGALLFILKTQFHYSVLWLPSFFLIATCLVRVEVPVFVAFVYVFFKWSENVYQNKHEYRELLMDALLFCVPCSLWFMFVGMSMGTQKDLADANTFFGLGFMYLSIPFLVTFKASKFSKNVFLVLISVLILFLCFFSGKEIRMSWLNTFRNTFYIEYWGFAWTTITTIFLVLFFFGFRFIRQIYTYFVFMFVWITLLLGLALLHPSRLGWGDSVNRMLVHFLPISLLLAVVIYQVIENERKKNI